MSVKHVKEYYLKVANDYHLMNKTLEEMEKSISETNLESAKQNIEIIRQQVAQLKENYLRLSYIMFLLNQPNKKSKKNKYMKQEQAKLKAIPNEHTMESVLEENQKILDNLQQLTK